MPRDFQISGVVKDRNNPSQPIPFEIELDYTFLLLPPVESEGTITTQNGGQFSATITISDDELSELENGIGARLDIGLPVPPGSWSKGIITFDPIDEAWDEIQSNFNNIEIMADFSNFKQNPFRIVLQDPAGFSERENLTLLLWNRSNSRVLGRGSARLNNDRYEGTIVYRSEDLNQNPYWLQASSGSVLFRTRLQSSSEPLDHHDNILLSRIDNVYREDQIDEIPDTHQNGVFVRNIHIGFVHNHLVIEGLAGFGVSYVQLVEVGEFFLSYDLGFRQREREFFTEDEFDSLLTLKPDLGDYDLFPDTDIDEVLSPLRVPVQWFEDQILQICEPIVRRTVLDEVASQIRSSVDAAYEDLIRPLVENFPDNGPETAEEIRQTLFFHPLDIFIENKDLHVIGHAGVWHWMAGLTNLGNCPVNTMAVMYPRTGVRRIFRHYQESLSDSKAKPLANLYHKHRKELADIVSRDPSFAGRVIRLAKDLRPMLGPRSGIKLSDDAYNRISVLIRICEEHGSPELRADIKILNAMFGLCKGLTFGEILEVSKKLSEK